MTEKVSIKKTPLNDKEYLQSFKTLNPDISDDRARELKNDLISKLSLIPEKNRAEHLKKYTSFDNNKHSIQRYLIYYIKREMLFHNLSEGKFKNRTIQEIQNEINIKSPLDFYLEYKGYIPFPVKEQHGSILLLIELAEIYEGLKTDTNTRKKEPEKKPLAEKINWKAGEDILRTHLEKLRDNFIKYENIDKVMSGDEIAVFIKHKTYKSINNNILALYDLWNEKNYISDYIIEKYRNDEKFLERQYKEFMENTFNWDFKGEIKNINHGSMGTLYNREIKKIIEVKKHFESILI